jgi:polysaccharide pyruvyl transferase WcaK-like protein
LEALLLAISQYQPEAELTCVCPNPRVVAEQFGIPVLPVDVSETRRFGLADRWPLRRIRRAITRIVDEIDFWFSRTRWFRSIDQFIVVGTGVLDDMGVRPWNAPYDLLKWCAAARLAGTPVVFMSVGAGPIENRLSRFLMLLALRMATYRSYRDIVSKQFLDRVGFNTSGDSIYPDLVFGLPEQIRAGDRPIVAPPETIGVGVMGYYGWRYDPKYGEPVYAVYSAKLTKFVRWLLDRGYRVRLLTGELPIDQRPVEELLAHVRATGDSGWQARLSASSIVDVDDLLKEIAKTDLVVATRFHNVVCALMLGRPVISIGYAKKNDALLAEMGLQAYCQHIESFSVEQLVRQFDSLCAELQAANFRIQEKRALYRQQLDEQYRAILRPELVAAPNA